MMKYRFSLLFWLIVIGLAANGSLPIDSFDYALPENNVSAIALGIGGINLTDVGDPFASYGNPALLGFNDETSFYVAYRLSDKKEYDFGEIVSVSNVLKASQFKYFTLNAGQFAFSYQPMASINISELDQDTNMALYHDYKLDKIQFSAGITDKKLPNVTAGINLKYLNGRLVYLTERLEGSNLVRERFIDDKVKGLSGDIGLYGKYGSGSYGIAFYDVLSRMWWENYPSESIQRRVAAGAQYGTGASKTFVGIQSKIAKKPETTYHFGYGYGMVSESGGFGDAEPTKRGFDLRIGFYSHDFYGADNINLTLGGGYFYQVFRFDFSLNSKGLKLADSELLFSIGLGM